MGNETIAAKGTALEPGARPGTSRRSRRTASGADHASWEAARGLSGFVRRARGPAEAPRQSGGAVRPGLAIPGIISGSSRSDVAAPWPTMSLSVTIALVVNCNAQLAGEAWGSGYARPRTAASGRRRSGAGAPAVTGASPLPARPHHLRQSRWTWLNSGEGAPVTGSGQAVCAAFSTAERTSSALMPAAAACSAIAFSAAAAASTHGRQSSRDEPCAWASPARVHGLLTTDQCFGTPLLFITAASEAGARRGCLAGSAPVPRSAVVLAQRLRGPPGVSVALETNTPLGAEPPAHRGSGGL